MKKRINKTEIEKAKSSNRFIFVLTTLMLLVVIGGLIFYVLYDKKLINFSEMVPNLLEEIRAKNTSSLHKIIIDNLSFSFGHNSNFDVKLSNKEMNRLFNIVKVSANNCENYNTAKSLKAKELSEKCKFNIASKIYGNYLVEAEDGLRYILESDVSYSYESLFGEGKYKSQEIIPYGENMSLLYSESDGYYFVHNGIGDYSNENVSYEKILSAKKDKNYLYINSAVLYYEPNNRVICVDYDCEEVLDTISEGDNTSSYFDLYIEHNNKKLNRYKYTFKLDKNGFYKYVGFEKTNK